MSGYGKIQNCILEQLVEIIAVVYWINQKTCRLILTVY